MHRFTYIYIDMYLYIYIYKQDVDNVVHTYINPTDHLFFRKACGVDIYIYIHIFIHMCRLIYVVRSVYE